MKLTCPVCGNSSVYDKHCSNCETDLSLIRMLMELPIAEPLTQVKSVPLLWPKIGISTALLLIGIFIGTVGNAFITQKWFVNEPQLVTKPSLVKPSQTKSQFVRSNLKEKSCTGFYYTVKGGDTLSQLSYSFYRDIDKLPFIIRANPQIAQHPDSLKVGTKILIPNQDKSCV